jgi:soluble lytic murein transglycosylase
MIKKKILLIIFFILSFAQFKELFANEYWQISASDNKRLKSALFFSEKGKWDEALKHANSASDVTIRNLIKWLAYRSDNSGASFKEIINFVKNNPDFPQQNLLKRKAEEALSDSVNNQEVVNWFTKNPPLTDNGIKFFAKAKAKIYLKSDSATNQEIIKLLKQAWIKGDYGVEEESNFIKKYGNVIDQQDHIARIDDLLWEGKITQAKRILNKVDKDHQLLFEARIKLMNNKNPLDSAVSTVPKKLLHNHGLLYDMVIRYSAKGDHSKVREILNQVKNPNIYQHKWWIFTSFEARELLQEKKYKEAYQIIINHNNVSDNDYAEAEWLAGWIALTYLKDKKQAYLHFYNLYKNVKYPISLARGAYWSGRANEGINDEYSSNWYRIAAKHSDTFYGQLATLKLKSNQFSLPAPITPNAQDIIAYKNNPLIKAAYLFAKNERYEFSKIFAKAAVQTAKTPGEITLISEFGSSIKNINLSVETAKHAAREKNIFTIIGYPKLNKIQKTSVEHPLALSIIRQESVFDQRAESIAGAKGLMQLMPGTAKEASKELNIKFHPKLLKDDSSYNVKLGSHSLKKLIDGYKGSYVLAIAAYNAGPGNVKKWLNYYGDPRNKEKIEEVVDWIESIPFYETRNYVQRVLENLQVYRVIAVTEPANTKLFLDKDLKR